MDDKTSGSRKSAKNSSNSVLMIEALQSKSTGIF